MVILVETLRLVISMPYTPLRPMRQEVPGSIPVNVNGDEIELT